MNTVPVIAVVGPTASGKSDLGVAVARALHGEVVNADSMQLYTGMDVGTAKLTVAERHGVPHHLLDIWPVTRAANVAEYQTLARVEADRLLARNKPPVFVGGSGLYLRGALDEFKFPGTDGALRERLEGELAEVGSFALHQRLAVADPQAAESILPSNGRRIVRALEVIELTGGLYTATLPEHTDHYPRTVHLGLDVDRPALDERIALRVDRMWEAGFVQEVRDLLPEGLRDGRTAALALGYAQVLRFLAGEWTEEQAKEETVRATKRFARRQDSWFRRDSRVHWLRFDRPDLVEAALDRIGA
ncbi:tRNA (adenosine(37)-N6)-dimethylallyltransferase MiaA [Catenulispora yoronensis]|uniref:tRNA (adenosine(37)-N6)-dimethylallyltransferase MiaA n=1 Tax=Catenulispora yoronensis TaxID=450799 RepID=UPI0031DA059F